MDKYNKGGRYAPRTESPGILDSLQSIETKGGMARASASIGVVAISAGLLVWLLFSLSAVNHQAEKNEIMLIELEKGVDHLAGKIDLVMSRLQHPGGDHVQAGGGGGGGGGLDPQQSRRLDDQLQRLTQGVEAVDRLKRNLESMQLLLEKGQLAADAKCGAVLDRACKSAGHEGAGGATGGRTGRLVGEQDIGKPARLPGEPKDSHASEALSQQTIKMNPGDPLPFVGQDYHPWFSNSDHSHQTTYVHLLKDKYGAKRKCRYIDVVFWNKASDRCLLVVPDREIRSRTVTAELDMTTGIAKPRPLLKRNTNPLDIRPRDERYYAFSKAKDEMVHYLRQLVGTGDRATRMKVQANPEPLLVMCANDGHLGLLLNWACSLRASGIDMPKHVVFVTSAKTRDFLRTLGFVAYYHNKIGSYPKEASAKYSDMAFGQMMILKQVAVALSLESGYDVLFQDIDITWLKDPRPELLEGAKRYEIQFQDDGARNQRYQPWFANTGFFYIRSTFVARDFWDRVTLQMPSYPQSNQVILNWVMEGMESRGHPVNQDEFTVRVLPQDEYVAGNGVDLPGVRNPGQATVHNTVRPLSPTAKIVHFCWTHNITFKIGKMKGYKSLYVSEECLHNWESCVDTPSNEWQDDVCLHTDLPPMARSRAAWLKAH